MFSIFVVTTKKSTRLPKFLQGLSGYDVEEPVIVIGEDYTLQIKECFDTFGFNARYNRFPSSSEVECALGHRLALNKLCESEKEYAIILEDDAFFKSSPSTLADLEDWCNSNIFNAVILGYARFDRLFESYFDLVNPKLVLSKFSSNSYICARSFESSYGAVGYIVSKGCAKELLENTKPDYLADDWRYLSRFIEILHVSPVIVSENFLEMKSLNGHENLPLRPAIFKYDLLNFVIRAVREIKHYFRLFCLWYRWRKRRVKFSKGRSNLDR